VSKPEDLDRLYCQVKHEKGKIDVLFANAGIGNRARLGEITDKHIDDLLSINIKGVILTVQKALPLLAPGASVILNASIAASKGFAEWSVYSATKAAVRSFARTWSADLKGRDIRINAVSPGVIDTPGYRLVGLDETRPSWPAFSAGPPTPPPSGGMEFPAMSQRWSASSPPTTVASSPEAKSSWMEGLPRSDLANQAPIHRRVFECRGDDVPPLRECPKTSPK
jgi:NAD(P)-dependent dehydrogenase (short-subunit alcohol dehydrogenase family)